MINLCISYLKNYIYKCFLLCIVFLSMFFLCGCDIKSKDNTILNFIRENNFLQNDKCDLIVQDQGKIVYENLLKIEDKNTYVFDQLPLVYLNLKILQDSVDKCFFTKHYYGLNGMLDIIQENKRKFVSALLKMIEKYEVNIDEKNIFSINRTFYDMDKTLHAIHDVERQLNINDADLQYLNQKISAFNNKLGEALDKKFDKAISSIDSISSENKILYIKVLEKLLNNIQEELKDYDTIYLKKFKDMVHKRLNKVSM